MSKSYCRCLNIAAVQLDSGLDREDNLARCEYYLNQAAQKGADVCVLPELFSCLGPEKELFSCSESESDCCKYAEFLRGSLWKWGSAIAKKLGIYLVMGTFLEKKKRKRRFKSSGESESDDCSSSSDGDTADGLPCINAAEAYDPQYLAALKNKKSLPSNTCCVFDNLGNDLGCYRKIHLFNCQLPGAKSREADYIKPGSKTLVCKIDNSWSLGIGVCYDLRFPEHFRDLRRQGANLLVVPAAFTMETGREHWEVLLRARAIENQAYVIAANQCGFSGIRRYGHSMIIDPWGTVIAQAGERPGVVMSSLDGDYLMQIRESFPQN